MGGGFMFAGNSASAMGPRPPFYAASGTTRSIQAPNSSTVNFCSGSQPRQQNIGDRVFGPVPSRIEVERAILELQRFMHNVSTSKSKSKGLKGLLNYHESEMLQSPGFIKFLDVFSSMQAEPSLRNLAASISCDKAVWEAIMFNEAVQDLRGSISAGRTMNAAKEEKLLTYPEEPDGPDIAVLIMRWIMGITKSKILQLVENFRSLVNEIFQHGPKEKPTSDLTDLLDEKVRSSLLLSVVIILIVVLTRGQG